MNLPNYFNTVIEYLNSSNQQAVYTGLRGLLALSAKYQLEVDLDRVPLESIIEETFPILGRLVDGMIKDKENPDWL